MRLMPLSKDSASHASSPALTAQVVSAGMSAADSNRPRKRVRVAGPRLPVRTLGSTLLCEPMLRPEDQVMRLYRAAEAAAKKPLRLLTCAGLYLSAGQSSRYRTPFKKGATTTSA